MRDPRYDILREPEDSLYHRLVDAGLKGVERIGDCHVPGALVHAVHGGHRYARELDAAAVPAPRRERVVVESAATPRR